MAVDPRDKLWESAFDTYYASYYQELFADNLVSAWRNIDYITKLLVAFTATGSVATGWVLWKTSFGQIVWTIIAGVAAIIAIVHSTLGVPAKLNDWIEAKQTFTELRVDLETFRHQMGIDSQFPLVEFKQRFNDFRVRYGNGMRHIQNDLFRTGRKANKIQSQVDKYLEGIMIKE